MGAEPRHLSEVLAELASLSAEPFDVHELVQVACDRAVEVLAVDGAVITLTVDGSPLALVAAAGQSDAAEMLLAIDRTPCAESIETGSVITYDHRRPSDAVRFPVFSTAATSVGLLHSMATPLRHGEGVIGMLSLMRLHDRPFDERSAQPARQLAEVIVAGIVHAEALRAAIAVREQLEHALKARVVIEQAKGMVAADLGISVDEALVLIRTFSRSQHLRLADVSGDIVSRKLPMMLLRS
jgi:transcriptional regulator with GAF, ATPase, and Fis domain